MATFDYSVPQNEADRLLADAGIPVSVVKMAKEHDLVSGADDLAVTQSSDANGVILPASESIRQKFQIDFVEELVKSSTEFLLISAKNLAQKFGPGDYLLKTGAYFEILGATPLSPAGIDILFWLAVKPVAKDPTTFNAISLDSLSELDVALDNLMNS